MLEKARLPEDSMWFEPHEQPMGLLRLRAVWPLVCLQVFLRLV
jgi:hypothetical protein